MTLTIYCRPDEAEKALEASREKHFFGSEISVEPHAGFESDNAADDSEELEFDEYHMKSTRTLFCGNLEPHTSAATLKEAFSKYGEIVVCRSAAHRQTLFLHSFFPTLHVRETLSGLACVLDMVLN